jgi:UDP-glucuronate 4-epimerase
MQSNKPSMPLKILVTGAAGFIGYHLCQKLIDIGHEVVGLDNMNSYYDVRLKEARLKQLGIEDETKWNVFYKSSLNKKFQFIKMNLEDREKLPLVFQKFKFDIVCNLAAQAGVRYSLENPMAYVDSNIVGFINLLECLRHQNIKKFIYASSSSVYGQNKKVPFSIEDRVDHPISLYAATKKSNELMSYTYSHLYGIETVGLRFFTVYGPWGRPDMAPMLFASSIMEDKAIRVYNNGEMSRDFTYIDDIIAGILIVVKLLSSNERKKESYQLFNIGNGSPVALMKFIETLETELGKIAKKNMLPMQPGDVEKTWADTKALKELGYLSETEITIGVKKFVKWFEKYYKSNQNYSSFS